MQILIKITKEWAKMIGFRQFLHIIRETSPKCLRLRKIETFSQKVCQIWQFNHEVIIGATFTITQSESADG